LQWDKSYERIWNDNEKSAIGFLKKCQNSDGYKIRKSRNEQNKNENIAELHDKLWWIW
jgi:hypothetical protein